ncbi:MAG: hypothetical protein V7542_12405 [Limnobacter sp.]|uniref:hypothetical protein n=1 Tax=Limnobacter sp. TaxID=2003368 RepID=UPI003002A012
MKRARFSDQQIVRILRKTDKDSVVEVAKRPLPAKATGSSRPFAVIQSIRAKRSLENSNSNPIPTYPAPSTDWTGQTAS